VGSASVSSLAERADTKDREPGKRSRRSWSRDEKRRIVEEASHPGASVADIARRHGLNANQVFNWRNASWAAGETVASQPPWPAEAAASAISAAEFMPIGMITRAEDAGPALIARALSSSSSQASCGETARRRPSMGERPGVIEIELPNGTRLRVDAFVNERALRRVLAMLKATS
jgi:transposase